MRALSILPLIALSASAVSAFDKIIAFADSFTDNGNVYKHSKFPVSPPYYQGRFSNGPTWLEHVAKNLFHIPVSNNGYGGATTNNEDAYSAFNNWTVPGLQQQVDTLNVNGTANDLYLVYIGYNDLNSIVNPHQYNVINKNYTKEKVASNVVNAVDSIIQKYNASQILVLNAPPFWKWPVVKNEDKLLAMELTESYNKLVVKELTKLNATANATDIQFLDDYTWWNQTINNVPASLELSTANGPCNPGIGNNDECKDPQAHFFYDSYHPEAKAHKAFGDWATEQLKNMYKL
ncbi:hypothetical protein K501DRAFT_237809 [Backusella circina FSU 941]|nr:hypothetical protein K501DRAFT_237809 [Backusella circina FSU 941]